MGKGRGASSGEGKGASSSSMGNPPWKRDKDNAHQPKASLTPRRLAAAGQAIPPWKQDHKHASWKGKSKGQPWRRGYY